jgi:thioredoxin reductase (NADPH)
MNTLFYDFIIVGAGSAGLSAAQYGARSNLSVLVLEPFLEGGQIQNIISLENYPGIFPAVSGVEFSEAMTKQTLSFGAKIEHATVDSIDKINEKFVVKTKSVIYECSALLIATGAVHRKIGIPGEKEFESKGVSYCATCDGPFFKNRKIVVIGGGDAACDEAMYLSSLSDDVTLIHRRGQLRAQRVLADRILKNPNIKVIFDTNVIEIKGDGVVKSIVLKTNTGEVTDLSVDGVFIFIGMDPRTELVGSVKKDESGYIITNERMETNIPGLFVAGDIRSKPFRQVITACSDGAIAAHCAREYVSEIKNEVYK